MNIVKFKYFIHLVEKERTGNVKDAAVKIGISDRTIFNYVNVLKTRLNAPINYNRDKKTFVFSGKGTLVWKWVKETSKSKTLN